MRYEPTANELTYLDRLEGEERLLYFISRTMENEEIWRLCDAHGWVVREHDHGEVMQLWPYAGLAQDMASQGEAADAVSLEYFVHHELPELQSEGVMLEIFPGVLPGIHMSAARPHDIFDHKMDEEQYFIEG